MGVSSYLGRNLLSLLLIQFLFYVSKDTGVPIPIIGSLDIWGIYVKNDPQPATDMAFENFVIWASFYFTAHILLYVEPQRSLFHPFKLNPNYPPHSLVLKEIFG